MNRIKTLYFIRHGESTANAARRDGRSVDSAEFEDSPLTDLGYQQACELGIFVSALPVETIVCSPLRRAIETAVHVFPGQRIVLESRAREVHWSLPESRPRRNRSPWEKATIRETLNLISKRFPDTQFTIDEASLDKLDASQDEFWKPKLVDLLTPGEMHAISAAAVNQLLPSLFDRPESVIAVVTHWGVLHNLLNVSAQNCALYKVKICELDGLRSPESYYVNSIELINWRRMSEKVISSTPS